MNISSSTLSEVFFFLKDVIKIVRLLLAAASVKRSNKNRLHLIFSNTTLRDMGYYVVWELFEG